MAGLSVIGAILAIIATAIIVCLAIYGGVTLLDLIESRVNERAFRKALDKRRNERANGDWTAVPRDFHEQESGR